MSWQPKHSMQPELLPRRHANQSSGRLATCRRVRSAPDGVVDVVVTLQHAAVLAQQLQPNLRRRQ